LNSVDIPLPQKSLYKNGIRSRTRRRAITTPKTPESLSRRSFLKLAFTSFWAFPGNTQMVLILDGIPVNLAVLMITVLKLKETVQVDITAIEG
jgi:hypothetical protein